MRVLISFLGLWAFLCNIGYSQRASLLWEISGKNLKHSSYLYGTMHVRDKRVFEFGDSVMIKLDSCKVFAGEIILNKAEAKKVLDKAMMPPGMELKKLLSQQDYQLVRKYVKKHLGVYVLLLNKIKPIFITSLIATDMMKKDKKEILDDYLQKMAEKKGMQLKGIETLNEQMASIDKLPLSEQAQMLLEQVKNIEEEKRLMEKMLEIYISQNIDSIHTFVNSSDDLSGEFGSVIIQARNYVMADRIEKMAQEQPTFAAIGTAHLPGKEGVINLLIEKGYTVRPVFSQYSRKKRTNKSK